MSKKTVLMLLFVILSLSLSAGCMRQASLKNTSNLPVAGLNGQGLSASQVKAAILGGAQEKGWVARELTPGVITASLAVRAHKAEVEIPYSGSSSSIIYKSSTNLDYDAGDQTIHNQYNNWVDYLRQAIDGRLAAMQ
ncbi:MAG: hypothetical protein LBV79_02175 [Candidatus Adiutrix sp.]|jgi:hypothetical protein|nr:hypothetical protein [Candidatus Adiutrix sp.]